MEQAERRNEPGKMSAGSARMLSPDALTIGFARRFATYKRANLILTDIENLASMVNDPKYPVQFVFSGKAHPNDHYGKRVLQQIAEMMRHSQFDNKFVFVEDYDINVGRHFVQGVDVWLNNPRRPLEASGTSGQKTVLNGGLNLSVLDGWWAEAYDGLNGFAIGTGRTHSDTNVHDARDGKALYRTVGESGPLEANRATSLRNLNVFQNYSKIRCHVRLERRFIHDYRDSTKLEVLRRIFDNYFGGSPLLEKNQIPAQVPCQHWFGGESLD